MCGTCAQDFDGYPDCKRKSEAEERDTAASTADDKCKLPLLPTTLEPLRDDRVHVHGTYFLDVTRRRHVIALHANKPSLLRVQADGKSPTHNVRVKVALERLGGTKHGVIAQESWEVIHEGDEQVKKASTMP
jgi:hypothetical protein